MAALDDEIARVDRDLLSTRLSALEGYLAELPPFASRSRETYVRERALPHLAERYLQLACECVLDITQHLISEQGYRQPLNDKDAIEVLHEEGLLEADLAERLKRWMAYRNVLVHLYLEIDHGRSYDAIRDDLGDLEEFAAAMTRFLRS